MKGYSNVTTPETSPLVVPVVPDVYGYALVPGVPCPCPDNLFPLVVLSRTYQVTHTRCDGPSRRVTTTTYSKDPYSGSGGTLAEWEAAWPEIIHTVEEEIPTDRASVKGWNLASPGQARTDATETCGSLTVVADTWDPGELADNPGIATYTDDTDVVDTDTPLVGGPDLSEAFEGDFEAGLGNGYSAGQSIDGDESTGYKSEWKWQIDLSNWPTDRDWPTGFELKGSIVWIEETDGEPLPRVEPYHLTAAAPVWTGLVNTDVPPGDPEPGESQVRVHYVPAEYHPLLPLP